MERLNAEPANDDDDDIDDLIDPEVMDEAPEEFEGAETDDAVGVEAVDDGESAPKEVVPVDAETWQRYRRIVEALLFASAEPMTERMLANRLPEDADVKGLLKELRETYAERGVHLVRAGASWAFRTAPDLSEFLNKEIEVARKLSRAAIETLSIIAYHQPVTRAEIEEILAPRNSRRPGFWMPRRRSTPIALRRARDHRTKTRIPVTRTIHCRKMHSAMGQKSPMSR